MRQFGIGNFARHSALADAQSTAELMLCLRPRLAKREVDNFRKLRDLYLAHRRASSPYRAFESRSWLAVTRCSKHRAPAT